MAEREDSYAVTAVSGGRFDVTGESAVLEFDSEGGVVRIALPAEEVTALLSVCIGLAGQGLLNGGEAEHATIPVSDWRVGVSDLKALVLGLAPQAGGALAFHLTAAQGRGMASALLRGAEMAEGSRAGRPRH